jgi:hypothetical protein
MAYHDSRWAGSDFGEMIWQVRWGFQRTPNHDVAPDQAAILVLRDTTPLQAARQVNAVVTGDRGGGSATRNSAVA